MTLQSVNLSRDPVTDALDYGADPLQKTHVVDRGETLSSIAASRGISLEALLEANPQIINPDLIYAGDRITLPHGDIGGNEEVAQVTAAGAAPVAQRHLSEAGLDLIKRFEGLRLNSYQDSAGVWTVGYGHTGADVQPGQRIDEAHATQLLRNDVSTAEDAVRRLVDVPLTQGQFDALVSFTFNCGAGNLERSTLLKELNAGDYAGAQAEFGKWVNAGGQRLDGLVIRREAEAAMFGDPSPTQQATVHSPSVATVASGLGTEADRTGPTQRQAALDLWLSQFPPQLSKSLGDILAVFSKANADESAAHVVEPGDTLWDIAQQAGVSLAELIAANPQIRNPDLVFPDQVIHLPPGAHATHSAGERGSPPSANNPSDLNASAATASFDGTGTPWMDVAQRELGQSEIAGSRDNSRIVDYHATTSYHANDDETPWCSSFVNWVMKQSGIEGTGDARAISWKDWGQASELERGAVVVLKGPQGYHVGLYEKGEPGNLTLLGGNQSDSVKYSTFGSSYEVVAVRSPTKH